MQKILLKYSAYFLLLKIGYACSWNVWSLRNFFPSVHVLDWNPRFFFYMDHRNLVQPENSNLSSKTAFNIFFCVFFTIIKFINCTTQGFIEFAPLFDICLFLLGNRKHGSFFTKLVTAVWSAQYKSVAQFKLKHNKHYASVQEISSLLYLIYIQQSVFNYTYFRFRMWF